MVFVVFCRVADGTLSIDRSITRVVTKSVTFIFYIKKRILIFSLNTINLKRMFHSYSYLSFCTIFFGYIISSGLLYYWYYMKNRLFKQCWKIQPKMNANGSIQPYHWILVFSNLFIASSFALGTTEMTINKLNYITFEDKNYLMILYDFFIAFIIQSILEYVWHIWIHTDAIYSWCHKFHHSYKSPFPFADMYIHPLEATGYYCILYSPPLLMSNGIHYYAFMLYMLILGICGILDHSGINFKFGYLYDVTFHDLHHQKFKVNYGFPSPLLDMVFGTYLSPDNFKSS